MHDRIGENRIKRVRLLAPLVVVLFMAQIFVPLVTFAQVHTDEHRIAFVLGTDENLRSLEDASAAVQVNISIYNATEAKSNEFSNESVIFLASLDNETVLSINSTMNSSANVFAYNLSSNISIGNVDDVNITKYWVYGSDENIENLIIYMDNKFYGNTTVVDLPKPPEGRAKITFVTTMANHLLFIERATDDLNISKYINVTTHSPSQEEPESYQNLNLSDQDVIMMVHLGYPIQDGLKETVRDAKGNGAAVIAHMFEDVHGLCNVNLSAPEYSNTTAYWDYGGEENMKRLIAFLGATFCNLDMEILDPVPTPKYGIYHPDAPNVFENTSEYLDWYQPDPFKPTIGIHSGSIPGYNMKPVVDSLIESIEDKGANVIFATYTYEDPNSSKYFIQDNKSIVDAAIMLTSFRLHYSDEEKGIEYLKNLNVTPIKGIDSYYSSPAEWENNTGLTPSEIAWQIALPELDGLTEFVFMSGKIKDPVSGLEAYDPVNYQVDWITDRAISWAKIHRMNNSDKKVAIIYYNHGGGKDNLGASYLDIVPSLTNLLDAMRNEGYEVEGEVPDEKELLDLMLHQGRNIGTWAPDELKNMVENESVVLLPATDYETWFNELPENKQQEVIDKWGEPPGEIMVYANATGKYLVIPGLKLGNILLAPQPTRGWLQDQAVLYHDKELAPHHQYIAFYFWLKKEYGADAIVHFGTHGTQEWLPGKETALSVRECWPAILIQDLPVVYPYIMDNVGEGTQAKRRGNAVIVDHLTPPIVAGGLYGDYTLLHEKIHQYLSANGSLKTEYRNTITGLYGNLTLSEDLGVSVDDLRAMNESDFEYFINGELHMYLHELADEFIPYGLHILGSPPVDWKLISMVQSMLGEDFTEHIAEVYPDPHELNPAHENCTVMEELLREVIFNGSSPVDAQTMVLGSGNVSANVTADLETARIYAENLTMCSIEIPRVIDGLAGRYVPAKVGNDPIRNPDALPTGNNFYSFDSRLIPTKEAWEVGKDVADDLLEQYVEEHGEYPRKAAFVLWAVETMRHQGIMESQILYLLGTRPVWDSVGRVEDVELIPCSELGRPRIDALMTPSGLYRDTFSGKIELLDKAVRLAYTAGDTECPNYVKENSDAIYDWLIDQGYSEEEAKSLSMARIFLEAPGTYGTGLPNAIAASNTWENETELADLYINRMGYVYGEDGWGVPNVDLFRQNLADVEVAVHSDSSNLFGMLDTDDYFQHLGGLALAVRSITGETPDLYVTNLRDPHDPKTETLKSYLRRELNARYFNPRWLEGMMEHDYAGAREMMRFTEHLWGWDVVTPDLITQDMWNQVYEVYIQDKYNLGLEGFFETNNPYALESIAARMLEAIRKDYWDPSDDVQTDLAETWQQLIDEYGVTCCHHTCGNLLLNEYMQGILSALIQPEDLSTDTTQETTTRHYHGSGGGKPLIWQTPSPQSGDGNETSEAGIGMVEDIAPVEAESQSEPLEGTVMEETTVETPMPVSGVPWIAVLIVILILGLVFVGFFLRRR